MHEGAEAFVLARSLAHQLHRAHQAASERFARKGHMVSLRQFRVLAAVHEHPGANQNDLVRVTNVDRSTLADMLKRLSALGLIEKSTSEEDARANVVALTELGEATLFTAAADARKADHYVLHALPGRKAKALETALERLCKELDAHQEAAEREERKRRKREKDRTKKEAAKLAKVK